MFKKMKKTPYNIIAFSSIALLMIVLGIFNQTFSSIILILFGAVMGLILYSLPLLMKKKEDKE